MAGRGDEVAIAVCCACRSRSGRSRSRTEFVEAGAEQHARRVIGLFGDVWRPSMSRITSCTVPPPTGQARWSARTARRHFPAALERVVDIDTTTDGTAALPSSAGSGIVMKPGRVAKCGHIGCRKAERRDAGAAMVTASPIRIELGCPAGRSSARVEPQEAHASLARAEMKPLDPTPKRVKAPASIAPLMPALRPNARRRDRN